MIDIRIICAHDAAKLAETLMRLLEAEQHRVRLTVGRQSWSELEAARGTRDAVLLIWSPDARSQNYMLDWGSTIDPSRLVEVALVEAPKTQRKKAPAIDFSHWRGERGERAAWNALNDRLRTVDHALNPAKPTPKYAALALGVASAAAVSGAVVLRMNDAVAPPGQDLSAQQDTEMLDPGVGLGGPLSTIEPASLDDYELRFGPIPHVAPLPIQPEIELAAVPEITQPQLRDATLIERISALNPLRQRSQSE